MDGFEDIIKEFIVESYENLEKLDGDLLALEEDPGDQQRLASLFRTVHTIKGTSGFLALPKLERVAHVGENLLVPLRDGDLSLNRQTADVLLEMGDAIRAILESVESGHGEGDNDYDALIDKLEEALNSPRGHAGNPPDENAGGADDASFIPLGDCNFNIAAGTTDRVHPVAESSVRLDVALLDKLVNLVGELVLTRNQIVQFCRTTHDGAMLAASQQLNLITTELQESVVKTRMQPIRNAWGKLPRLVRDLACACGKKVEVRMEGDETEIDKTVLEAVKDPLTHIVRNAVDHGIESPDDRVAVGKPPIGVLLLKAFHEGGLMIIEIRDDGAGINAEHVRAKAVENGIVSLQQAAALSEKELTDLILLPGFTTAHSVTNVSGRGVGMDVVKTNIESIGGSLDVISTAGLGTTLRIKIPLTLAIIPALLVRAANQQFAIPQVSLVELVRADGRDSRRCVEYIHSAPVFRLRERLLPLVYLDEQLGLCDPRRPGAEMADLNIVVLQADGRQFGLIVDEITDTQEIVVKPLGHHLREIPVYAGATIMGDGTVSLILEVLGLAHKSGILDEASDRCVSNSMAATPVTSSLSESLLLVDPGNNTQAAIRLSSVARLEKFAASDVQRLGEFNVIEYHGQTVPLFSIPGAEDISCVRSPRDATVNDPLLHTVVYREGDQLAGVVVEKIVDILNDLPLKQTPAAGPEDQAMHMVIGGRVTEVIDLKSFLKSVLPKWTDKWSAA